MIQDEIRPNIDDLIGEKTKTFYGGKKGGFLYGEAVGVTEDGKILINPEYQAVMPAIIRDEITARLSNGQIGGNHYQGLKIQPVEYNYANGLPFIEGNVVKYITRHRNKNKAEDVKKAIHFCVMLLKLEYGYSKEELEKLL